MTSGSHISGLSVGVGVVFGQHQVKPPRAESRPRSLLRPVNDWELPNQSVLCAEGGVQLDLWCRRRMCASSRSGDLGAAVRGDRDTATSHESSTRLGRPSESRSAGEHYFGTSTLCPRYPLKSWQLMVSGYDDRFAKPSQQKWVFGDRVSGVDVHKFRLVDCQAFAGYRASRNARRLWQAVRSGICLVIAASRSQCSHKRSVVFRA